MRPRGGAGGRGRRRGEQRGPRVRCVMSHESRVCAGRQVSNTGVKKKEQLGRLTEKVSVGDLKAWCGPEGDKK